MLRVQSLGLRVYKTSVNPFNKHLGKSYKTLAKEIQNDYGLGLKDTILNSFNKHFKKCYKTLVKIL